MSSGCGDVLSLADLQTAKKHQLFEAEVITGKQGGVSTGADIDYATNQVTGQTQKTLPAVLRDAGFRPASFDFTTGGVLSTSDRDKVVYDPVSKTWYSWAGTLPKTIPAATNPLLDANWRPQTDPNIRSDLSSTAVGKGASLVGLTQGRTVQAEVDILEKRKGLQVFLDDYANVTGDGVANDSAGLQAAILDVAQRGGGTINFGFGKTYYIRDKTLLASGVMLDLRGSTIKGERVATSLPTFETATLISGALVSNISAPNETQLLYNAGIRNGYIKDCYQLLNAKNFIKGCVLENLDCFNCRQIIIGSRCFYSSYVNLQVRGGSINTVPVFYFTGENNAMYFERVTATVGFGFQFTGGTTAVMFEQCTYEGGVVGFDFQGDCYGVHWNAGYFEAVQGTLFRFLNAGTCTVKFTGNYVNLVDVVIQGGGAATSYLFGVWDKSNAIVRVGEVDGGFTYRGLVILDNNHDYLQFEQREDLNTSTALPTNLRTGPASSVSRINVLEATGPGDVFAKGIISGNGVVPVRYSGNMGKTVSNTVPFCTHAPFSPGSSTVTILLDTKIAYTDSAFAKFNLLVAGSAGNTRIFGDIYGTQIKRQDGNTATMNTVLSNAAGYMRIEIGPFTSTGGGYTLTGTVQVCS